MRHLLLIYLFTILNVSIVSSQNAYSKTIYHEDEDEFPGWIIENGDDILLVGSVRKYDQDEMKNFI